MVRKGFLELAKRNPSRIIVLNGNLDKEIILNKIWIVLKEKYGFKN